jgi:hypothetical protein
MYIFFLMRGPLNTPTSRPWKSTPRCVILSACRKVALIINHLEKNAVAWTNLGLLYLHHGDLQLANEVLYHAQTLEPDHAVAWIGQILVATADNRNMEADLVLEHAMSLVPSVVRGRLSWMSSLCCSDIMLARSRSLFCFKGI